jgi:hypothetical protein
MVELVDECSIASENKVMMLVPQSKALEMAATCFFYVANLTALVRNIGGNGLNHTAVQYVLSSGRCYLEVILVCSNVVYVLLLSRY